CPRPQPLSRPLHRRPAAHAPRPSPAASPAQWQPPLSAGSVSCAGHFPDGQREITNLPKATPRLQPSPLPASASETSPLVITWAPLALPALAWASGVAYVQSTSSMPVMPENSPRPSRIVVLPMLAPPPLVRICTAMLWPLSQVTVPLPLPVL